ncbi:helix-hairpin-helix domain-containing protein [Bacillus sp. FJAT-42315]|uniref:helix-hairpin-helix domain-containing protein n=1 Tax=Bacillus sp. FJAT-42315 TaxID=2014077 RepID=UPI0018E27B75|nr:helix-hairpin-helix domain-containing protein [Bacillus sp. FJAT-42315]
MDIKGWLEKYKTHVLIATGVCAFGLYQLSEEEAPPPSEPFAIEETALPAQEKVTAAPTEVKVPEQPQTVTIDIKGAVKTPGIYSLSSEERINDAVVKAGGFQKEADRTTVNLAQKLQDEMVIYIPKVGEEPPATAPAVSGGTTSVQTASSNSGEQGGAVNINTATSAELQELPGIGEAKAQAIIDYRETTGAFAQAEDLKNVSGIGDKTFEKLQPLITVN